MIKYMGRGQTHKHTNKQTCRQINIMTRTGLRAGPSEKLYVIGTVHYNIVRCSAKYTVLFTVCSAIHCVICSVCSAVLYNGERRGHKAASGLTRPFCTELYLMNSALYLTVLQYTVMHCNALEYSKCGGTCL